MGAVCGRFVASGGAGHSGLYPDEGRDEGAVETRPSSMCGVGAQYVMRHTR